MTAALLFTVLAIVSGLAFVSPSLFSPAVLLLLFAGAFELWSRAAASTPLTRDLAVPRLLTGAALLVMLLVAPFSEHRRALGSLAASHAIVLPDPSHASANAVFAAELAVRARGTIQSRKGSSRRLWISATSPISRTGSGRTARNSPAFRRSWPTRCSTLRARSGAGSLSSRTGAQSSRARVLCPSTGTRWPSCAARCLCSTGRSNGDAPRSPSRTGRPGTRSRRGSTSTGAWCSERAAGRPPLRRPVRCWRPTRETAKNGTKGPHFRPRCASACAAPPVRSRVRLPFRGEEMWGEIRPVPEGYRLVAIPGPDFLGRFLTAALLIPGIVLLYVVAGLLLLWRILATDPEQRRDALPRLARTFRGRLVALFVAGVMVPLVAVTFFLRSTILTHSEQDTLDHARTGLDTARRVLDDYLPSETGGRGNLRALDDADRLARQLRRLRPLHLRAGFDSRGDLTPRPLRGRSRAGSCSRRRLRDDRTRRRKPVRRLPDRLRRRFRGAHDGALGDSGRAGRAESGTAVSPSSAAAAAWPKPRHLS